MNSRSFVYILILTLITTLVWVVADIYHSHAQVNNPPAVQQLLEPIDSNFDRKALDALGN